MEKKFYALTKSGAHYNISEETASLILQGTNDDRVEFDDGSVVTIGNVVEVMPYDKYVEAFPDRVTNDMHQPYSFGPDATEMSWDEIKSLPGQGYDGLLNNVQGDKSSRKRKFTRMLQGLNAAKAEIESKGRKTPQIDRLIQRVTEKINAE